MTWVVKNADGATDNNNLTITEQRGGVNRTFQHSFNSSTSGWDLLLPDAATTVSAWASPVTGDST